MKSNLKKFKLCSLSMLSAFVLCGCGGGGASTTTLTIRGVKLGYGIEWMEKIIEGYTAKTGNKVVLKTQDGQSGIETIQGVLKAGGEKGTDIYFSRITDFYKMAYEDNFVDLTDVYTEKDSKTGKSIEDRTNQAFLDAFKVNGKYVGFAWANGIFGFVRNNTLWNALGFTDADMPYTTDEFFALCDRINEKAFEYNGNRIYPLVYSYESEYYTSMYPTWYSQYEGSENVKYFNEGIDPDDPIGSAEHHTSNFFVRDGIVESLKVIEKLVKMENGYQHPKVMSYEFKAMQNDFLRNKTAVFMPNGSWLDTETNVTDYDVEFIDTPIVSSIIDNGRIDSIKDDATLSSVVKYVRGVTNEKPVGVSDNDIEVIRDAVSCGSFNRSGFDHHMVVSKKSQKIGLAKDFLKYMFSDEGLNIFRKTMNGGVLSTDPANGYSDEGVTVTPLKQNVAKKLKEGNIGFYSTQVPCKLFCYGGINRYCSNGLGNVGKNAIKAMVSFKKTPQEIFNMNKDYLDKNWASILKQAGLN